MQKFEELVGHFRKNNNFNQIKWKKSERGWLSDRLTSSVRWEPYKQYIWQQIEGDKMEFLQ